MVLVPDLLIIAADDVSADMRVKCNCCPSDFIITRPRSRKQSRVVNRDVATLLEFFRTPMRIVDVAIRLASDANCDPESTLENVFVALQPFLQARWLVSSDSSEANSIEPTLHPGDEVDGWEVLECVNLLEDTEVYQARANGRIAALKVGRTSSGIIEEGQLLEQLELSVVPKFFGMGRLHDREFLLMHWCNGISVSQFATEMRHLNGASAQDAILPVCCDILGAFSALHAQGIAHGDIYGNNILIDADNKVSIIDFGSARRIATDINVSQMEIPRRAVPEFYEPEYAAALLHSQKHLSISLAGEQYALAVLIDLLLTGSFYLKFSAEREPMLRQIAEDHPLTFAERGVPAWPALEIVLRKALEKQPASRFSSVAHFHSVLRSCVHGHFSQHTSRSHFHVNIGTHDLLSRLNTNCVSQFPLPSQVPACSLAYGAAGIAYALYCDSCREGNPAKLSTADAWIQRALAMQHDESAFTCESLGLSLVQTPSASVFFGLSGTHLVHALISQAMGDAASLRVAIANYLTAASTCDARIDLVTGKAGILTSCATLLDAIAQCCPTTVTDSLNRVVALAATQLSDIIHACEAHPLSPDAFLGQAHGLAGACYAVLQWCEVSADLVPISVVQILEMLEEQALPNGRGVRWAMKAAGTVSHYHEGWCHGAAGYVLLWTSAWRTLGHERYLRLAERAAWTAWEAGNCDASLCCGYAGRAYSLVRTFNCTGNRSWLSRAFTLRDRALAAKPNDPRLTYSLLKGKLGAALLSHDLENPHSAGFPLIERNARAASIKTP